MGSAPQRRTIRTEHLGARPIPTGPQTFGGTRSRSMTDDPLLAPGGGLNASAANDQTLPRGGRIRCRTMAAPLKRSALTAGARTAAGMPGISHRMTVSPSSRYGIGCTVRGNSTGMTPIEPARDSARCPRQPRMPPPRSLRSQTNSSDVSARRAPCSNCADRRINNVTAKEGKTLLEGLDAPGVKFGCCVTADTGQERRTDSRETSANAMNAS